MEVLNVCFSKVVESLVILFKDFNGQQHIQLVALDFSLHLLKVQLPSTWTKDYSSLRSLLFSILFKIRMGDPVVSKKSIFIIQELFAMKQQHIMQTLSKLIVEFSNDYFEELQEQPQKIQHFNLLYLYKEVLFYYPIKQLALSFTFLLKLAKMFPQQRNLLDISRLLYHYFRLSLSWERTGNTEDDGSPSLEAENENMKTTNYTRSIIPASMKTESLITLLQALSDIQLSFLHDGESVVEYGKMILAGLKHLRHRLNTQQESESLNHHQLDGGSSIDTILLRVLSRFLSLFSAVSREVAHSAMLSLDAILKEFLSEVDSSRSTFLSSVVKEYENTLSFNNIVNLDYVLQAETGLFIAMGENSYPLLNNLLIAMESLHYKKEFKFKIILESVSSIFEYSSCY